MHAVTTSKTSSTQRWLTVFLAIGLFLRLFRYAVAMPVWGDEAFVGLNIINRGFAALLQPLDYAQVAPPGFLLAERTMYLWFGMGEYAMRFLPMLAGLAALLLFAYWARLLASPNVVVIAVAIMAIGNYPVRYAVELKPYGIDMFASLLLLIPATLYFLRKRKIWLGLTIILLPFCLAISFPAIFIAGAIGFALLTVARKKDLVWTAIYAIVAIGCFLILMKLTVTGQFDANRHAMTTYWSDAFPPTGPRKFLIWFVQVHTGNMFAYPFGAKNGGSVVSFFAFLVGIAVFFEPAGGGSPSCSSVPSSSISPPRSSADIPTATAPASCNISPPPSSSSSQRDSRIPRFSLPRKAQTPTRRPMALLSPGGLRRLHFLLLRLPPLPNPPRLGRAKPGPSLLAGSPAQRRGGRARKPARYPGKLPMVFAPARTITKSSGTPTTIQPGKRPPAPCSWSPLSAARTSKRN